MIPLRVARLNTAESQSISKRSILETDRCICWDSYTQYASEKIIVEFLLMKI